jgi:hypothetical protein
MSEDAIARGMITSALLRGALAEAGLQRKDREEGFGTWSIDTEPDNTNTHIARPETD